MIPNEPGDANHAIVSATSTGSPPCAMLFILRPASRVAIGIAAVIAVSMNPGATALIVVFASAQIGAYACTAPMIPAFEVA